MDIYDAKDSLENMINDVINTFDFPQEWQVWGSENGWEILDDEGMVLNVSLDIIQEVNYGR